MTRVGRDKSGDFLSCVCGHPSCNSGECYIVDSLIGVGPVIGELGGA